MSDIVERLADEIASLRARLAEVEGERERDSGKKLLRRLYDVADGSSPCVGSDFEALMASVRDYLGKSLAQMQAEKNRPRAAPEDQT